MARHFLFGPVTQTFAEQNLHEERALGNCLTFGPAPGVDLVLNPDDTWDSVATRFPANWHPDMIGCRT